MYSNKCWAPTVLTHAEEKEIVVSLQVLQEIGFGLTKELAGLVIRDYLRDQPFRPNPFNDGIPGRDWWQLFLKRWSKDISERKPKHLPTNRATSATPEVFDKWFKRISKLFVILDFLIWMRMNCNIDCGIVMRVGFALLYLRKRFWQSEVRKRSMKPWEEVVGSILQF